MSTEHQAHPPEVIARSGPPRWLVGILDRVLSVSAAVLGLLALVIVLDIVFVVFDANGGNAIVTFILDFSDRLLGPVATIFTPDSAKVGALVNGGIGAVLYLVVARVLLLLQPGRRAAVR